jgi:catechol 2,3-dioxygenase-like lactoylglutathione lyase family enzyme
MDENRNNINQDNLVSLKTVIRTKDFVASKKFYTQILNLKIVEEYDGEKGVRGCIFRIGRQDNNAFLEISEIDMDHYYFDTSFNKNIKNDKIDIQIKTDSIGYWADHLKGRWKVEGPVDRPWGSKYLYLRDPDGLQIIIYQE